MSSNRKIRIKEQVIRCLKGMCGFIPAKGAERQDATRYFQRRYPFEDDYMSLCGENLFTIYRKQAGLKFVIGVFVPDRAPWNGEYVSLVFKTLSGYDDEYVIRFPISSIGVPEIGTTVRKLLSETTIPKTDTMRRLDLACSRARALIRECIVEELSDVDFDENDYPKDTSMRYAEWSTITSRVIDPKKQIVTKYFVIPLQPERGCTIIGKFVGGLYTQETDILWKFVQGGSDLFDDKGWKRVEKLDQLVNDVRLVQLRHLYNEL